MLACLMYIYIYIYMYITHEYSVKSSFLAFSKHEQDQLLQSLFHSMRKRVNDA